VNLEEGSGDLVQRRRRRSGDACVEAERAAGVCATLQSLEAAAAHLSRSGAKVRRVCVAKGWSQAELCEGRRGSDLVG
jgi:hypothetical protein